MTGIRGSDQGNMQFNLFLRDKDEVDKFMLFSPILAAFSVLGVIRS